MKRKKVKKFENIIKIKSNPIDIKQQFLVNIIKNN